MTAEKKAELIQTYGRKEGDTGSPGSSDRSFNREN